MITEDKITEIFCMADDFCKLFDAITAKYTLKPTGKRKYHRSSTMSKAEVMLIMILFHTSGYRCFKHFYLEKVCKHLRHLFPNVVSYNRLVTWVRYKLYAIILLLSIISMFISGFFGNRLYAMSPAIRFVAKLSKERCLVCSIWHTFFSSSFTVSMTERFLSNNLSYRLIREFFMFFFILVTKCILSTKSISKRFWLIYPLSAKSFPNNLSGEAFVLQWLPVIYVSWR